jgi:hypothetical protein
MTNLPTLELTIEELTAEAMQLLNLGLDELYVILGCQLMGAAEPARVAEWVSHQSALRTMVQSQCDSDPAICAGAFTESGRSFDRMVEELKADGIRFITAVQAELSEGLCGKEISDFAEEISSASMQVIVLIVAAVLKLPRQIEAVSATVAAIFCKAGVRQAYA